MLYRVLSFIHLTFIQQIFNIFEEMCKVLTHGKSLQTVMNMTVAIVRGWEAGIQLHMAEDIDTRKINYSNNPEMTSAPFRTKETKSSGYVSFYSFPVCVCV